MKCSIRIKTVKDKWIDLEMVAYDYYIEECSIEGAEVDRLVFRPQVALTDDGDPRFVGYKISEALHITSEGKHKIPRRYHNRLGSKLLALATNYVYDPHQCVIVTKPSKRARYWKMVRKLIVDAINYLWNPDPAFEAARKKRKTHIGHAATQALRPRSPVQKLHYLTRGRGRVHRNPLSK